MFASKNTRISTENFYHLPDYSILMNLVKINSSLFTEKGLHTCLKLR